MLNPTPAPVPRFFCPNLPPSPDLPARAALDAHETRHARKVLRLSAGDRVELFDGQGMLAHAAIDAFEPRRAICQVHEIDAIDPPRLAVTMAAAIPKGHRADEMIDQLSQLGADRLIPLRTQHSVVDPGPARLQRFSRLAVESAKQARRLFMMRVEPSRNLERVVAEPFSLRLLAAPAGGAIDDLPKLLATAASVLVLIGPEGGWTAQELDAARSAGCRGWEIGPHVLRVGTAAVAALAIVRYLSNAAPTL